jgi:hypothetical protein
MLYFPHPNKNFLLKICLFLLFTTVYSLKSYSNENYPAGARPFGLSNAYISLSGIWTTFHNQAGLTCLTDISTGFYYESKFNIDKLSLVAGSVVLPVNSGVFGLSFLQFGKGTFSENKFGLAFARHLGENLNAGIQFDYFTQTLPENRHAKGFVTFEGGIIYQPLKQIFMGVHIFNPLSEGIEFPSGKQKMPVIIRAGGHYLIDKNVIIIFETEKNNLHPAILKTGIEFLPVDNLAIRFGASGKPFKYTAGIGYQMNSISTDIGFSYHGNLGVTPSLSIQFRL